MSMPSFPKDGANMSREQALTMIIASIAMEERALGYIIEAEGDKLRHVLDKCPCGVTPQEVLKVNKSVTRLLETAAENQSMLRCKLALAVDASGGCSPDKPCPPEPPCPRPEPPGPPPCWPCEPPFPPKPEHPSKPPCDAPWQSAPWQGQKSLMHLCLPEGGFLWKNDCPLPWQCRGKRGGAIHWNGEDPAVVRLDPGKAYLLSCTFFLPTVAAGEIRLEGTGRPRQPLPLCFPTPCAGIEDAMLQYSTLLLPGCPASIYFRLRSKIAFCVRGAELNIVEL